jgi:hypothetical protein
MPPTLVIFSNKVLCFMPKPASIHDPPIYTSCVAGITGVCHHSQLVCWDGVCCLTWPPPVILLISTSRVAGITGVKHQTQHFFLYFQTGSW